MNGRHRISEEKKKLLISVDPELCHWTNGTLGIEGRPAGNVIGEAFEQYLTPGKGKNE